MDFSDRGQREKNIIGRWKQRIRQSQGKNFVSWHPIGCSFFPSPWAIDPPLASLSLHLSPSPLMRFPCFVARERTNVDAGEEQSIVVVRRARFANVTAPDGVMGWLCACARVWLQSLRWITVDRQTDRPTHVRSLSTSVAPLAVLLSVQFLLQMRFCSGGCCCWRSRTCCCCCCNCRRQKKWSEELGNNLRDGWRRILRKAREIELYNTF